MLFGVERATDTFFYRLWSVPIDIRGDCGGLRADYDRIIHRIIFFPRMLDPRPLKKPSRGIIT